MFPRGCGLWNACLAVALLTGIDRPGTAAQMAAPPGANRPLAIVPPGTPVGDPTALRWNRVVLMAVPRIAAGNTEAVPQWVRDRMPGFTLVVLATVRPAARADGRPRHDLLEIGAGYAVSVAGRLTVVDTEAPPADAGVDFLGRQILSQNGKALTGLSRVGGSDTVQVFDAESLLFRDGHHEDFLMRHFVWADPATGQCSACVWLLAKREDGGLAVVDEPPRWVPAGTREDRGIHVDENEFLLGVPTKRAFALVDLPPGRRLEWTPALKALAATATCPPETVTALAAELDRSLESLRAIAPAGR
ncbi:MAG: hypothetical protein ACKOTB_17510 [Planctomycetia bacterium]